MSTQAQHAKEIDRKGLSSPALRTFFRIAALWDLSVDDQMTLLGGTARSTLFKWKKDPNTVLPKDTLEAHLLHRWNLQGAANSVAG